MEELTILVAEDNPDLRSLLCATLAQHGYRTVEAVDGRAALELARACRPALILMDLAMPGLNGLEAARALSADPELGGTRILAITASVTWIRDADDLDTSGFAGVIMKPFTPSELLTTIEQLLSQSD